ncbi:hypothetical protein ARMSODRAFT_1024771 [Armillaria solidipes]|uniref:Uncharacterized protein n=1 Tax=Armillaria solidipes TaxID=1076256 RepID=A0A2H3AYG8_9AGAR|nr:hypothetical protein ARMSODRAFT_1024771 [Armillaria solidipes]
MINLSLNCMILRALLYGLYTGIVVITLWTVFSSPKRLRSAFLCTIIIALHILSTIAFGNNWTFEHWVLIDNGDNYYSIYSALLDNGAQWRAYYLIDGITGGISTLLVDITIIWRCWTLWDRQWQVVSMPILCGIGSTVIKVMQMFSDIRTLTDDSPETGQFTPEIDWSLIYIILMLATTLICTLLIVYRIVRKAREMSTSRKIIEMLIQSSAMYSLFLIVYLALVSRNLEAGYYADTFVVYVKVTCKSSGN